MPLLSDLRMYGRFALGMRSFLRNKMTLEQARTIVRERLARREESFLGIVRDRIFGYARSPYLPLLKEADCAMADIETSVERHGMGGEPPTPAKVREIERVGARCFPYYVVTEIGSVGSGCGNPVDQNDCHLFEDNVALIQHPRFVPGTEIEVDAFHFTTLVPTAPKILLNVESDD